MWDEEKATPLFKAVTSLLANVYRDATAYRDVYDVLIIYQYWSF